MSWADRYVAGAIVAVGAAVFLGGGVVTPSAASSTPNTIVASATWREPLDVSPNITGKYNELRENGKHHQGIDLAAPNGTPVHAAKSGKVIKADGKSDANGYGNWIIVQHADDWQTYYAHLSRMDVKVGDVVSQGQVIGAVGSTGHSTGNHLHFETRHSGSTVDPISVVK